MALSKTTQKWVKIAYDDLKDAKALLQFNDQFLRLMVFAAQQSAEKIIKAYLSHHQIRFQKTHNIEDLVKQVRDIDAKLASEIFQASDLTQYAIAFRYPDAAKENLTLDIGRKCVEIAETTYKAVVSLL